METIVGYTVAMVRVECALCIIWRRKKLWWVVFSILWVNNLANFGTKQPPNQNGSLKLPALKVCRQNRAAIIFVGSPLCLTRCPSYILYTDFISIFWILWMFLLQERRRRIKWTRLPPHRSLQLPSFFFFFFNLLILERNIFLLHLFFAFIGWFLYVTWPGSKPSTSTSWEGALPNCAKWPRLFLLLLGEEGLWICKKPEGLENWLNPHQLTSFPLACWPTPSSLPHPHSLCIIDFPFPAKPS